MDSAGLFERIRQQIRRRRRMSARLLIVSSVVTVLGFSGVCGSIMLEMRRSAQELSRQTQENLASTISADVNRNIELYDLSLRSVISSLALPQLAEVDPTIRNLILFDHSVTAQHFGQIQVFDAKGDLVLDSATLTPERVNRAGEAFFRVHLEQPDLGLYISRPMQHRGAYALVLSRRVVAPDGSFAGVVAGSIRFSYFQELFSRLRLAPQDVIAVLARDGTLIMRTPFDPELLGTNMMARIGMDRMLGQRHGWFAGEGKADKIPRMYVWADSSRPLIALVGRSWSDVFGMWRHEALRIGAILLGLAIIVAGFTVFFIREIDRRAEAERQLEELATTDPLTGLTNRRKFDLVMDREWRRAVRSGTPIALLIIDADHFKSFNDSFGHPAGDQVLVGIALCIADSANRAGDCAARLGGEEFAVLLSGLQAAEAQGIAETIRRKVEVWSDGQAGVTISIGLASMTPAAGQHWSMLFEAADKALYAAKDLGRNCCVVAASRRDLNLVA
ncbi:diguanylate cyclase [Rhodopseudomonas sp. AAP120]|jgi:diguanylate cyclase (GGDEF)-like protein|uniref:sensor domain-containing diguanylate cyclase n=1 Tax=Rhodopseudomonas sp. AAP120 TaxID=1523430 RepID=UPI0006B99D81|nr:diguanylate cyclase [Rhodopseudomonas sp. AAP120]KPF92536.1 diguanylate cyclase [Rhodopseudomonas sp. AAP120]